MCSDGIGTAERPYAVRSVEIAKDIFAVTDTMYGEANKIHVAATKIEIAITTAANEATRGLCKGCGGQLDCDECQEYRESLKH